MRKLCKCIVIIAIPMTFACNQKEFGWQGTIEEINGVKVVNNPKIPVYGELILDLEEDLSIGNDDDDNYMFFRIGDIKVDNDGNIYVLERGNIRVQKFTQKGEYICTFGNKGQGPSEFMMPYQMIIDEINGMIYVQDIRKVVVFDKVGNYLDADILFEKFPSNLIMDSSHTFWGSCNLENVTDLSSPLKKTIVKFDEKGQIASEVVSFPYNIYREGKGEEILSIITGFEYDLFLAVVNEKYIAYGHSQEYELNIIDLSGSIRLKIKKDEPYLKFTPEEMRKYKRFKLPEYKPFFFHLFSDSEERIYVQCNQARVNESVGMEFDIFSKDGFYLYKLVCPLTPFVIKKGYFYTQTQNDETGEVQVKRFKINNWNDIRETV